MATVYNSPNPNQNNTMTVVGVVVAVIVILGLLFWVVDSRMADQNESDDAFRGNVINNDNREVEPSATPVPTPSPTPVATPSPSPTPSVSPLSK